MTLGQRRGDTAELETATGGLHCRPVIPATPST
jgi:hypothetical protein